MAAGYDGTIRIDSSIDGTGFNKGVSSMMGALGPLAKSIVAAFSVAAIVAFGKKAIQMASDMQVVKNRFDVIFGGLSASTEETLGVVASQTNFLKDDLMGFAATLQVAFLNLGYTSASAANTSVEAIKRAQDLAVFWGEDTATIIGAIQMGMLGMTRGLRQYNVVIDENKIKAEAQALGLWDGVGAMNAQVHAAATLQIILNQTAYAQGTAAASTHTWAGEVRGITSAWTLFTETLGQGFITALMGILPVVQSILNWLIGAATWFANAMGFLFGKTEQIGTAAIAGLSGAASAAGDLATNTAAAGKAAKGALAAFDQLNVLQQADKGTGAGAGVGGGVSAGGGGGGVTTPDYKKVTQGAISTAWDKFWKDPIQGLKDAIVTAFQLIFIACWTFGNWIVNTAWPWIKQAAVDTWNWIKQAAIDAFNWIWQACLDFGNWIVGTAWPWIVQAAKDAWAWIVQAAKDAWAWIKQASADFVNWITEVAWPWIVQAAKDAWKWIKQAAADAWEWIKQKANDFGTWMAEVAWPWIKQKAADAWEWVKQKAGDAWEWIKAKWADLGTWFNDNVTEPIKKWFKQAWEDIKQWAADAVKWVQDKWGVIGDWIKLHITDPIKDAFGTALDWVKEKWETVFGGVKDFVKGIINGIIGFINGMLSGIAGGINAVITAINSLKITLPTWIPVIGGKSIDFNIPLVNVPYIPPLLATGAVIPPNAAFAAILGDQRSGRNIETPEALMRQIVREEMGSGGQTITINFAGNLGALMRVLKPYADKENIRIGGSLIR
jgi:hypothetical protein